MAAVLHDARQNIAQAGLAFGFAMPFDQHGRRHLDVAAKLLCRMTAQEQSVEKCRFALREVEVVQCLVARDLLGRNRNLCRGHGKKEAVYSKSPRRQGVCVLPGTPKDTRQPKPSCGRAEGQPSGMGRWLSGRLHFVSQST